MAATGVLLRRKVLQSLACVAAAAAILAVAAQTRWSVDVTEDRRNSFPLADARVLPQLEAPLVVTVHLAPEDPRYADLRRNVLSSSSARFPMSRSASPGRSRASSAMPATTPMGRWNTSMPAMRRSADRPAIANPAAALWPVRHGAAAACSG